METKAEILAWLRGHIAERWEAQERRAKADAFNAGWHDGWKCALEWVASELDTPAETTPCS